MSNRSHLIILFFLYLISFNALAVLDGQGTGNGGDVLVCKNLNGSVQNITLYDFHEASFRHDINLDLDSNATSLNEKVTSILNKIKRLNPTRAALYEKWWKEFQLPENTSFTNDHLSDIPDTGEVTYPANCEVVQAAHQKKPMSGERRYIIKKDLWNQMDVANKAGLVIHELIYREAREENSYVHTNSKRVRYLNATFFSHEFNDYTNDEYLYTLIYDVLFDQGDWHGMCIEKLFTFNPENIVFPGNIFSPSSIERDRVYFYQDKKVKNVKMVTSDKALTLHHGGLTFNFKPFTDGDFSYYPDGQLKELPGRGSIVSGKPFPRYEHAYLSSIDFYNCSLHPNGQIKNIELNTPVTLFNDLIKIQTNSLNFSSTGFLIGTHDFQEVKYKNIWYPRVSIHFSDAGDNQIDSICTHETRYPYSEKCGPFKQILFRSENFQANFKATSACSKKPSDYLESTKQEAIKKCNDFLNEKLEPADLSLFSCPTSCVEEKCDGGSVFSSKKQVVCTSDTKYNN